MILLSEGSVGKPVETITRVESEKKCCSECKYFKAYFVMWYCTLWKKCCSPHSWCCNFKKKESAL